MSNASLTFNKIDPTCSNIYLLDQDMCLATSIDVLNSNFSNLSSALLTIETTGNYLNKVVSLFTSNSGSWKEGNLNLTTYSDNWNDLYNIVSTLSSTWTSEFSLFYTTMIDISAWNALEPSNYYSKGEVLNWLNDNFNANNFSDNQIISVYVNLYEDYYFDLTNFKASFYHDCHVPHSGSQNICGQGCSNAPTKGCHQPAGTVSTNAYDGCSGTTTATNISWTCFGYNAQTINIPSDGSTYSVYTTDRFAVRSVRLRYKKYQSSPVWTKIS